MSRSTINSNINSEIQSLIESIEDMKQSLASVGKRFDDAVENDSKLKEYRCLLYTSPSPRDGLLSRMPSSA